MERRLAILEVQRDGALVRRHERDLAPRVVNQPLGDRRRVAERRGHEEELRPRQDEERHLPRHAPLLVGVVVELVHDHVWRVELFADPERHVREDLRRAADDAPLGIDARVARAHPDVLRPQLIAEGEELLARERLDRARVERDAPFAERLEVQPQGDEGFAGAGRRPEDDVLARHDLQERLLLRRVERQPRVGHPVEEEAEDLVGVVRPARRDPVRERGDARRRFRELVLGRHGVQREGVSHPGRPERNTAQPAGVPLPGSAERSGDRVSAAPGASDSTRFRPPRFAR